VSEGSITLGEAAEHTAALTVACTRCDRAGKYRLETLIARHGADFGIPDLLRLLSDEDLIAYLARCRNHHSQMISQHMRYTAGAVVPTGDFLAHVGDWTGLPPAQLLGLMRGAAPVSAGASARYGSNAWASPSIGGGARLVLSSSIARRALRAISSQLRRLAMARPLCFRPESGFNFSGIDSI